MVLYKMKKIAENYLKRSCRSLAPGLKKFRCTTWELQCHALKKWFFLCTKKFWTDKTYLYANSVKRISTIKFFLTFTIDVVPTLTEISVKPQSNDSRIWCPTNYILLTLNPFSGFFYTHIGVDFSKVVIFFHNLKHAIFCHFMF